MKFAFTIDGIPYSYDLEGNFFWGKDNILFCKEGNLIEKCIWKDKGYEILSFTDILLKKTLQHEVKRIIQAIFAELEIETPVTFQIEDYHQYIHTQELHQKVIQKTRWLTRSDFHIDWHILCQEVSNFLQQPVGFDNPLLKDEIIILRISRPGSLDINPLHRDGYLDLWENVINLWLPIAGCNKYSSLPVLPGSHLWNEKDILRTENKGASINGLTYHVPAIVKANYPLDMIRPNPQPGEALVFTPYLIHGSALNLNSNQTRFSLELRLSDQRKK